MFMFCLYVYTTYVHTLQNCRRHTEIYNIKLNITLGQTVPYKHSAISQGQSHLQFND